MNPTCILCGYRTVIGPGFLNQVPTLPRLLGKTAKKLAHRCGLGLGSKV